MQTLLKNADVEAMSDLDIHRQDIATHRVQNPMGAHGIYGGEQEVRFNMQRGRLLQQEVEANMKGKEIRNNIKEDRNIIRQLGEASNKLVQRRKQNCHAIVKLKTCFRYLAVRG